MEHARGGREQAVVCPRPPSAHDTGDPKMSRCPSRPGVGVALWLLLSLVAPAGAGAGPTITLTGTFHQQKKLQNLAPNTTVECKAATFYLHLADSDTSNNYILQVRSSVDTLVRNVTIIGDIPLNNYWNEQYKNNNSAAFSFMDSHGGTLENAKITRAWDALRAARDSKGTYVFRRVHVEDWRDDVIETDTGYPNTLIEDCLFDGGYTGISSRQGANSTAGDASSRWLRVRKVLLRLKPFLGNEAKYGSTLTHNCPMKLSSNCQSIEVTDSVFAVEKTTSGCWGSNWTSTFKNKLKISKNNLLLWLGSGPFPSKIWVPPGFTTMSGQQAKDEWQTRRAAWLANTGGSTPAGQPDAQAVPADGGTLDGGTPGGSPGVSPDAGVQAPLYEIPDGGGISNLTPRGGSRGADGGCMLATDGARHPLPWIGLLLWALLGLVRRRRR
jgi:hypothetical protein